MRSPRNRTAFLLGSALALLTAAAVPVAAQSGGCYRAEIAVSMELPGGKSHEAGQLKLCLERKLSPVQSLHTLHVGGYPTGFLASQRVEAEEVAGPGAAYFVFEKVEESGTLRLLALVAPDGRETVAFVFAEPKVRATWAPGKLTHLLHAPDAVGEGALTIAMAR
jgi:hypothetical protein